MSEDFKLSDEAMAHLRLAEDAADLARRWNCSVSTARRRVRKAWKQVLPEALAALEAAKTKLEEVNNTQTLICKRHNELTYSKLHEQLAEWKLAAERARWAPKRSYLVWRAIGRKQL